MKNENVRVRFAPSPTGPLHIGGVRTVLYNYLFAKKNNGKLILRIEDTDQNRFVEGAEKYIVDSLEWCGIKFDESIDLGGEFGPYKQSERKEIYEKFVKQLIDNDKAYYAFDTSDELEEMRNRLKSEKKNPQYDAVSRLNMKNSLSLSTEEVKKRLDSGETYVIRIKIPENENIEVNDMIRGKVVVNSSKLDDKVLFKSDGMPTYHLANIVDDHLMEISHVIRGEEWLPSAPLHVLLYRYFGWKSPEFAHLPLLLKPDGNGKLSKRDGDRLGFPVFPLQWVDPKTKEISSGYREAGYFPEAFINMLALLGWNPGTEQELFTMDELIEAFSIDRVGKSGSKFDPEKAKWFNHQYLIAKSDDELAKLYMQLLEDKGITSELNFVKRICKLIKERANFVEDLWNQSFFFFQLPESYDAKIVKKKWKENTPQILIELIDRFENINEFVAENIEKVIKDYLSEKNLGMGQVMNVIRLSLVGSNKGPDLFTIIELMGKEEFGKRIKLAIKCIENEK
ncbi:MAG: glutamate--tRNA ligase [Bacteroidales bacterium]|nr:glutamate--tRNA ligase [Bacteroidales bacterium]